MIDAIEHTLKDLIPGKPIRVGIIPTFADSIRISPELVEKSVIEAAKNYDIVVAPEYSFFSHEKGPSTRKSINDYLEKLKEASETTLLVPGTFIWYEGEKMFNTCYVLFDGEVIHQQDKIRNGGEISIAGEASKKMDGDLCYQSGEELKTFLWRELKVGVEICADYGGFSRAGETNLDLIFLVSAGEFDLPASMKSVKEEGYGVVADGFSQVYNVASKREVKEKFQPLLDLELYDWLEFSYT
jgi:hypothetical protein